MRFNTKQYLKLNVVALTIYSIVMCLIIIEYMTDNNFESSLSITYIIKEYIFDVIMGVGIIQIFFIPGCIEIGKHSAT